MAKPSVVPTWATSATGISRTTDPGGAAADAFAPGDRLPSSWANFLWHHLSLWAAYLNAQDFEGNTVTEFLECTDNATFDQDVAVAGTLVAAGITTSDADVHHGDRVSIVETVFVGSNWFINNGSWNLNAATAGYLEARLPMSVGQRIKSVRVIGKAFSGAAADFDAQLIKRSAASGAASPTDTNLTSVVNSTATTDIQTITLTPTADTVTADETFHVAINGANSAGVKTVYRVEVTFDRP
jgi:hypothetical protein